MPPSCRHSAQVSQLSLQPTNDTDDRRSNQSSPSLELTCTSVGAQRGLVSASRGGTHHVLAFSDIISMAKPKNGRPRYNPRPLCATVFLMTLLATYSLFLK